MLLFTRHIKHLKNQNFPPLLHYLLHKLTDFDKLWREPQSNYQLSDTISYLCQIFHVRKIKKDHAHNTSIIRINRSIMNNDTTHVFQARMSYNPPIIPLWNGHTNIQFYQSSTPWFEDFSFCSKKIVASQTLISSLNICALLEYVLHSIVAIFSIFSKCSQTSIQQYE